MSHPPKPAVIHRLWTTLRPATTPPPEILSTHGNDHTAAQTQAAQYAQTIITKNAAHLLEVRTAKHHGQWAVILYTTPRKGAPKCPPK